MQQKHLEILTLLKGQWRRKDVKKISNKLGAFAIHCAKKDSRPLGMFAQSLARLAIFNVVLSVPMDKAVKMEKFNNLKLSFHWLNRLLSKPLLKLTSVTLSASKLHNEI